MAGFRTNTLVSTGEALFVMLSVMTVGDSSPNRIVAQVLSGIGFLGAGVIMWDGHNVRGFEYCRNFMVFGCNWNTGRGRICYTFNIRDGGCAYGKYRITSTCS